MKQSADIIGADQLEHAHLHWWMHNSLREHVRIPLPSHHRRQHQRIASTIPVMEPFVSSGARDAALSQLNDASGSFLVAFDVWWRRKTKVTKGFAAVPGDATWFFQCIVSRLPLQARNFYQVLAPDKPCGWYFDLDVNDPGYDMERFLHALFEEMCAELSSLSSLSSIQSSLPAIITPAFLWTHTLLLDASCNSKGERVKASCHGICNALVFADNHDAMKRFALRLMRRLEARIDPEPVPLDVSVYSRHRCFRMYGNSKMAHEPRPLVIAPYNQMPTSTDEAQRFVHSMICQDVPANVSVAAAASVPVTKKRRTSMTMTTTTITNDNGGLRAFLLQRLREWGNGQASIQSIAPGRKYPNSTLYVSFSNATHASNHQHESNNLYAIVSMSSLSIEWHCHRGAALQRCKVLTEPLPFDIACALSGEGL